MSFDLIGSNVGRFFDNNFSEILEVYRQEPMKFKKSNLKNRRTFDP
jgi:hypothetical protein